MTPAPLTGDDIREIEARAREIAHGVMDECRLITYPDGHAVEGHTVECNQLTAAITAALSAETARADEAVRERDKFDAELDGVKEALRKAENGNAEQVLANYRAIRRSVIDAALSAGGNDE